MDQNIVKEETTISMMLKYAKLKYLSDQAIEYMNNLNDLKEKQLYEYIKEESKHG